MQVLGLLVLVRVPPMQLLKRQSARMQRQLSICVDAGIIGAGIDVDADAGLQVALECG